MFSVKDADFFPLSVELLPVEEGQEDAPRHQRQRQRATDKGNGSKNR